MWSFKQATGNVLHDGRLFGRGYAGLGEGKNNPAMQHVHGIGPLPVGLYDIGTPIDHPHLGHFVLPLTPHADNEMFGRSEFFIHGDNGAHVGQSSHGCPILNVTIRHSIADSGDSLLAVTP